MAKMIFVNLPVSDLARATAFYQAVGAEKNDAILRRHRVLHGVFRNHPRHAADP